MNSVKCYFPISIVFNGCVSNPYPLWLFRLLRDETQKAVDAIFLYGARGDK